MKRQLFNVAAVVSGVMLVVIAVSWISSYPQPSTAGIRWEEIAIGHWVSVPYWIIFVLTAILPALWLYRRIRYRKKPGHCPSCGYNLKGTIEAGRTECPECGKPIEAKA